jgi:hypothetical protein
MDKARDVIEINILNNKKIECPIGLYGFILKLKKGK